MNKRRAIILGLGRSGSRFMYVLTQCADLSEKIEVCAVCDQNQSRLNAIASSSIVKYRCFKEALSNQSYDLIIICTNDQEHYGILDFIKANSVSFQRIVCEKPLTETLSQAAKLGKEYTEDEISVNFVERYSPVTDEAKEWISKRNLSVKRAGFSWGKYRIHDTRPTMGVLSEMAHPIDLVLWLSSVGPSTPVEVSGGSFIHSNFSSNQKPVLDSANFNLIINQELLINCSSSYLLDRRERKVILYLGEVAKTVKYQMILEYDNPLWDLDSLTISDVSVTPGSPEIIHQTRIEKTACNPKLFTMEKIKRLLDENVSELEGTSRSSSLVRLSHAIYVQYILSLLQTEAHQGTFLPGLFAATLQRSDARISDQLLVAATNNTYINSNTDWDSGF